MSGHRNRAAAVLACAALVMLSAPAIAADMRVKAPVLKAPPPVVVYGWSGFYEGIFPLI
jgi:outer membrane immunogenic protein